MDEFECRYCYEYFYDKKEFLEHVKDEHEDEDDVDEFLSGVLLAGAGVVVSGILDKIFQDDDDDDSGFGGFGGGSFSGGGASGNW